MFEVEAIQQTPNQKSSDFDIFEIDIEHKSAPNSQLDFTKPDQNQYQIINNVGKTNNIINIQNYNVFNNIPNYNPQ